MTKRNRMADDGDKLKSAKHIHLIGNKFREILKEPELFLCAQPEKYQTLCKLLQQVYQVAIRSDAANVGSTEILPELVVDDMHEEQIWQQLELRNNLVIPPLVKQTSAMNSISEELLEIRLKEDGVDEEESQKDEDESLDEEEQEENNDSEDMYDDEVDKQRDTAPKKKLRSSIVDDQFFKLGEMEAFLEAEDAKEMHKQKNKYAFPDNDGIDYFDENLGEHEGLDEEDDEESNPEYKDFFDVEEDNLNDNKGKENHTKQKDNFADSDPEAETAEDLSGEESHDDDDSAVELNEETDMHDKEESSKMDMQPDTGSDTDDEETEEKPKSSFEMRQERLEQRIRDYEDEVLGEKPWQLKGEIQATNRPQNSLLEEVLEFESTTRPAPVITEETTRRLEDIIRQRIKDQAWDDVELKVKPILTPQDYRKQLVLDQEKSKQSLAQIYEKEYQNELEKLDPNHGDNEKEEPKEHKEIRSLMRSLFVKLDALSNFHFTPKPVAPEPKIITNTPAINMEEVAPVAVSDATLLAPEEILKPAKQPIRGETERTKTDKNRERRKKKQKQRAIHKVLEAKDLQKQKMGISLSKKEENAKLLKSITKHRNVEKITASADQGSLKSSTAFFSKLQDTTLMTKTTKATKKKVDTQSLSAKKLKL